MIDVFQLTIKQINDILLLNICIYKNQLLNILKNLNISELDKKKIAIYFDIIYKIDNDNNKRNQIFFKFNESIQKQIIIFALNSCVNTDNTDKNKFNDIMTEYLYEESNNISEYDYMKEAQYIKKLYNIKTILNKYTDAKIISVKINGNDIDIEIMHNNTFIIDDI